jgi:hypothetical protein
MPDGVVVHAWTPRSAAEALATFAALTNDLGDLADAGFAAIIRGPDSVQFVLRPWVADGDVAHEDHERLLRRLDSLMTGENATFERSEVALGAASLTHLDALAFALFAAAARPKASKRRRRTTASSPRRSTMEATPSQRRMALFRGDVTSVGARLAGLVKRARDVKVQWVRGEHAVTVVAAFEDDPRSGATYQGVVAGEGPAAPDAILQAFPTAAGDVLVPTHLRPTRDQLRLLGAAFAGLRRAGLFSASAEDVVIHDHQDAITVLRLTRRFRPALELFVDLDPRQPWRIDVLTPVPPEDADLELRRRMSDPGFPVGYRVRLASVPERLNGRQDTSSLREQVERLESQIAIINALGAQQMRLLRFSDAQLPALVDVIRQVPKSLIDDDALLYAANHTRDAPPSHFVLYDPQRTALHAFMPEATWRGKTEDRPITYWLDPYAAEARSRRRTASSVFTPTRTMLTPSLAKFGGDLDETLALLLGRTFRDAETRLSDPDVEALYVFTPMQEAGVDMEIELLDARAFVPLRATPRWINRYLAFRSSVEPDASRHRALMESLFVGPVADEIDARATATLQRVQDEWVNAERGIVNDVDALTERLTRELEAYAGRMTRTFDYLEVTAKRIAQVERYLRAADRRLRFGADTYSRTEDAAADMEARQQAVTKRLQTQADAANGIVDDVRQRIEELRRRADDLQRWVDGIP